MNNRTLVVKPDKDNKFVILYKLFPAKLRTFFKLEFSKILGFSPTYLYKKIILNRFEPHERALISYHLGIEQKKLFPNEQDIFELSDNYKSLHPPFYSYFFPRHHYSYDPNKIIKIIYSQFISEITQNL